MDRSVIAAVRARLQRLRYSYLFVPGVMALGFVCAAGLLVWADSRGGENGLTRIFPAGPAAARTTLSVIAGSLITVAGVAFSITIVTLQLVSQQFTPRALRNFLGDRLNQSVAGIFIGVFAYCLVVLTAVEEGENPFVPGLSLSVAFALTLVALAMLLVFINHMAHSIQVSDIASRIAHSTLSATKRLYPSTYGDPVDDDPDGLLARWQRDGEPLLLYPDRPGFVESIGDLPATLGGRDFRIALFVTPGDFVTMHHPLAAVWTRREADACTRAIRRAVAVTNERDLPQDVAYGVRQLTDIAVRALSPSVNDPTTATTCIGYVQAILEQLAARDLPHRVRHFADREVTLILKRPRAEAYLEALIQISRYASGARVANALLRATLRVTEAGGRSGSDEWWRAARAAGTRIYRRVRELESIDEQERRTLDELHRRHDAATSTTAQTQTFAE